MLKKNRLSHSQTSMFQVCPRKYSYHYVDRLRQDKQSGALFFGSAIDKATEALVNKDPNYLEIFDKMWTTQELNEEPIYLKTSTKVVYSDYDYDEDLLTDEDMREIDFLIHYEARRKKEIVGWEYLSEEHKSEINKANWLSMRRKGYLMLEAVQRDIVPNIKEVLGTQVEVNLKNNEGDSILGYADLVCRWKDIKKPVVMDFKTSSIRYEANAVTLSPQLTLYVHDLSEKFEDTRYAGFIVLYKRLKKNKTKICQKCKHDGSESRAKTCDNLIDGDRCKGEWTTTVIARVETEVIVNEISEQTENVVLENFDLINKNIKMGHFHRNLNSCKTNFGLCPYYAKCFHDSNKNLVRLKPKQEE